MMQTVLNLGLTPDTVDAFARATGNERLAWDAWRRFLQMYGSVVLEVDEHRFDATLAAARERAGAADDTQLDVPALMQVADEFQAIIVAERGADAIPSDPHEQLEHAITAVFDSWNREPARVYRAHYGIAEDLGTAVNVQMMVFGNAGDTSASGVLFTRDPASGERVPYGEYLQNAQGEDVVSGMRTPQPVAAATARAGELPLEQLMPDVYDALCRVIDVAEEHYRDAQDMEFCVESGALWMLQTRTAKRTVAAAVRMAVEMVDEELIDVSTALRRVEADRVGELLVPRFERDHDHVVIGHGMAASPGAATGELVLDAHEAELRAAEGRSVILARGETSASDIAGMVAAAGMLTARGGATSHAAVVARGMGRPCVTACEGMVVDEAGGSITIGDTLVRVGDAISVDGSSGEVLLGSVPTQPAVVEGWLERLLGWADDVRTIEVRANADDAASARRARELGARGIGLCRTEHMFFDPDRLPLLVRTIMSSDDAEERALLEQLSPRLEDEFARMFEAMDGLPVTIRLLDPPLHEFLPSTPAAALAIAEAAGASAEDILATARNLAEQNPMLGLRGVRLSMVAPVVYEMQVRWIARAARRVREAGGTPRPAVMVPLVMVAPEFRKARALVERALREELGDDAASIPIGSMLEVPSACLTSHELALDSQFFSFGTNDLTQLTLGLSRDDAESFLPRYVAQGLLPADPFVHIDEGAVVPLMEGAVTRARQVRPDLEVGACGEHAGDPTSIAAMRAVGLDYVSCSPLRVPAARLAGAQVALDEHALR
jgi:pyruvate,orthophosphate dikinase